MHFLLSQITPTDLASFLEERRAQGYLVVAVEQVSKEERRTEALNLDLDLDLAFRKPHP